MTTNQKARLLALRSMIETLSGSYEGEVVYEYPELFKKWSGDGVEYVEGVKVAYDGDVYRVLTTHTSQQQWTPKDAPSLFAKCLNPDPSVIPDWEQPSSTNPYMKGDKVKHVGKTWISLVDNNVWEPGAVGTETLWGEVG